ncbi:MAG: GrpB family protein [Micrococcales bacterium]|nr:GrpB family protein [Micrococcales bacterium]
MGRLEDMTLEQLWQLFPIQLRPHNPAYASWFAEEAASLQALLVDSAERISHIGSTAVPGLVAKPIVDILLELAPDAELDATVAALVGEGWLVMSKAGGNDFRVDLNKGYTAQGFADRVFHLHLVPPGDHDELYFRHWLRQNPPACAKYEALKRDLLASFEHNRDAYTAAKTDFIRSITEQARQSGLP